MFAAPNVIVPLSVTAPLPVIDDENMTPADPVENLAPPGPIGASCADTSMVLLSQLREPPSTVMRPVPGAVEKRRLLPLVTEVPPE